VPPADEGESLTYEGTFRDPDEDGVVVVNRADGVVTFARTGDTEPGPYKFHDYVHQVFPTIDVGDLNGDGNPDYAIAAEEGPYFISGTVPPGTHDPRDVGVGVTIDQYADAATFGMRAVGDQNGDGADDIALGDYLFSGRRLLAKRAGSTVHIGQPFATVSSLNAVLRLDADGPPALVQMFGAVGLTGSGDDDPIEVKIGGVAPTCLVTNNSDVDPSKGGRIDDVGGSNSVNGFLVDGHRIVEYSYANRNTLSVYRWDLDA
jgi:hypothetical protein